ncbi:MAG: Gfo/Idh/MocA family oxidoreductase [Verrucomicrobia bacterium]|nr:Gfo/Idh/MocA family oxidoreductase [Verrucomicrobiota bacterium]
MNPAPGLTRRTFLHRSTVAGAVAAFPAVLRAARPNSKVQIAAIGVSARGYGDLHSVASHPQAKFVAFCDVDEKAFAKADADHPGTPHFSDFRVMLAQLGDKVDAVIVATPDHIHAPAAIAAMQRGKHVFCQKPLAHTVWECRQMRLWAEKKGVVTQMGNQIHSAVEYRLATRLLREGAIGKVKAVHSWVGVSGNERTCLLEPPAESAPVPAGLSWDLWLGPAPGRPYAPGLYHPFAWRDWQDFGGGALGDFGCHILDPVFTGLGLTAPLSVAAENSGINRHIWPTNETVRFVFPGNELTAGPKLEVTWTDGGLRPERKLARMPAELDLPKSGSLFLGEKGNLVLPHVGGPRLYPTENFQGFTYPKDIKGLNHWHLWVDAILAGGRTSAGFHYAGWLAETVQLGNVATRVARRTTITRGTRKSDASAGALQWDAANLRFKNSETANALLSKAYRSGWEVPAA